MMTINNATIAFLRGSHFEFFFSDLFLSQPEFIHSSFVVFVLCAGLSPRNGLDIHSRNLGYSDDGVFARDIMTTRCLESEVPSEVMFVLS